MKVYLILEDGAIFTGTSIGSQREAISEIVFNTSMADYLGVLTDSSYAGQAVVMTYPLIGNYGICHEDMEPAKLWLDGYIIRGSPRVPNNFRSKDTIQNFLKEHDIPGISGINTRAFIEILREKGIVSGMITTKKYTNLGEPTERMKEYNVTGVVLKISTKEEYVLPEHSETPGGSFPGAGKKVALIDYGVKKNIARSSDNLGCEVTTYPADTPTGEVLAACPDGTMFSNDPGGPKGNTAIVEEIKKPCALDVPIFAICPGHQLIALASGVDVYKLKYGHRGGNHPVKDLETGRAYTSSQNHGYVVDMEKVDLKIAVPAFVNVNDGINEGLGHMGKNIFAVQYHPEVCLGSLDSGCLFDRFLKTMEMRN